MTDQRRKSERNVFVYTKSREGKADGEPVAVSIAHESFESLKNLKCAIKKTVLQDVQFGGQAPSASQRNDSAIVIDNIYYVLKGKKTLPIVAIINEDGITQALNEYPLTQKNGHRTTAQLRLACDWHWRGEAVPIRFSPRRHVHQDKDHAQSSKSNADKKVSDHRFRIEVHSGVNLAKNTADGPIFTIYNVQSKENLTSIKKLVREKVPGVCLRAGFYWLPPKQVKPLHTLQSDDDLETAKDAYRDNVMGFVKGLRLAAVVQSDSERTNTKRSLSQSMYQQKVKRVRHCVTVGSDDDDDDKEFDDEAFNKFQNTSSAGKPALKDNNAQWNKSHIDLRKSLEETGQLSRFGVKHLSLWTDLIQKGEVSGPKEEPDWSKHKHIIDIEPMPRHSVYKGQASRLGAASTGSGSGSMTDLLTTMLLKQEMRREEYERKLESERKTEINNQNMFQALMLQALSPRSTEPCASTPPPNPTRPIGHNGHNGLMSKTSNDVKDILALLNLAQYIPLFMEKEIDGSTLYFITEDGLKELGVLSPLDRSKILGYIAREKTGI